MAQQLKEKRKTARSNLKRIHTFMTDTYSAEKHTQEMVEVRCEELEKQWTYYDEIQQELEVLEPNKHDKHRVEVEEIYFEAKATVKKILNDNSKKQKEQAVVLKAQEQPTLKGSVTLPAIKVTDFDGRYEQWQGFYDVFMALIDADSSLSDIAKLFYLRSYVKGEAFKLIESVPVSAENYKPTLQLLVDRYNNSQYIVNAHLKALFELPNVTKDCTRTLRLLISETKQHLRSLETLKLPVKHWDGLIVFMLTQKLDNSTRTAWELHRSRIELPKLSELYSFLENRCISLEAITYQSKTCQKNHTRTTLATVSVPEKNCKLCTEKHNLYQCEKFKKLNHENKLKTIKELKVCFNCLRFGHIGKHCTSQGCRTCGRRHNTLIHPPVQEQTIRNQNTHNEKLESPQTTAATALCNAETRTQIILSTARVMVLDKGQQWIECKVLLDNASQCNFVTRNLVKKLNLSTYEKHVPINGINQTSARTNEAVQVTFTSKYSKYKRTLEFLILDSITRDLPVEFIKIDSFNLPEGLKLADTCFNQPSKIDMLIGGEIFFEILGSSRQALGKNLPYIQSSALGWIVSGKMMHKNTDAETTCCLVTSEQLDQSLRRFWELEHCFAAGEAMSVEERKCEELFAKTTCRNAEGRYVVSLPLRESTDVLGDSYTSTEKRFKRLEFRMSRNQELKNEYTKFMNDYVQLGHMQKIETKISESKEATYYIPHHAVYKDNDISKIRVVFDASMATNNNKSLNDILMVGPVVQQELFNIILRFRKYKITFLADIKKMYRQILVSDNDKKLQRIIWRENEAEELGIYELLTVTYGTSAAPYLATKCIQHLAQSDTNFPIAAKRIQNDTYVDDILTGADSVEDALILQRQIIELLKTACLELHKWCSNSSEILNYVGCSERQNTNSIPLGKNETKTLGLLWSPGEDILKFVVNKTETSQNTKRAILSTIASIFDPLGLLAPVTLRAKLIMQDLWRLKIEWDSELETPILQQWQDWQTQISSIKNFQVERRIITVDKANKYELHGFSDASQTAYGASLYIKAENDQGQISVRLICSKSRVAPLKQVSLPRLELCGFHLLAKLTQKVNQILEIEFSNIYLWTDSTIVLSWLAAEPTRWTTFVANRVADIQEIARDYKWRHISTKHNPADLLTRGLGIAEMKTAELWWEGPQWLKNNKEDWPEQLLLRRDDKIPEEKSTSSTVLIATALPNELFMRFSTLKRLQRVVAYCLRFFNNLKLKKSEMNREPLTPEELNESLQRIIKLAQQEAFVTDIKNIKSNKQISNQSHLKALSPFLDKNGLLRIGGRLQNALIPYDQKHPLILPPKHPLTSMVLKNEHIRLLHAGCQSVLSNIRLKYWPVHGKSELRKIVHNCVKCFRFRAQTQQQLMAQLPKERVQPAKPFLHTGIDYAGPIFIKTSCRRNSPIQKAYISLFVCLSTKAIHLEAVTSLSTDAFLNALRRFISRRGKPAQIRSDNGTNFKGASNQLKELHQMFHNEIQRRRIIDYTSNEGISWKFIPANSPHHGGIWESGIKSTKYHLKRIMGNAHLNYEELTTLLAEIEACLNSRPLFPINNDPQSYEILTPSHFLIGDVLTKIPVPDYLHIKENRLQRWQLIQKLNQQFWKMWSTNYLAQLQQRNKWQKESVNLSEGMLVLVKEDNLPPLHWALARIKRVHPGNDGKVRVATIQTSKGTELQRPITKLCPLPIEDTSRAAGC